MFPPLISNMNDPLSPFSDAGVHSKCFEIHPLAATVNKYVGEHDNMISRPVTDLKGDVIDDPKDVIFMGMLTSDQSEELHKYNFLVLNNTKLASWTERELFLTVAQRFLDDGKWKGYGDFDLLKCLIERFYVERI